MFDKLISLILSTTTAVVPSFTEVNMQEYTPPETNYLQTAVDNGEQAAKENDVPTVEISILATTGTTTSMRTNVQQAHTPMPLGSLARVFILVKAVQRDKSLIKETKSNDVIEMMTNYSKDATDKLWQKYGGPKMINEMINQYDLQETIVGSNWDNTYSSAVDVTRLLNRFFKDKNISENQKEWTRAMLSSTATQVGDQDFGYGVPFARGIQQADPSSSSSDTNKNSNIAWIQGAPMNTDNGLYKHSVGIFKTSNDDKGTLYITAIMATFPDGTGDAEANDKMNKIAKESVSDESLGKSAN